MACEHRRRMVLSWCRYPVSPTARRYRDQQKADAHADPGSLDVASPPMAESVAAVRDRGRGESERFKNSQRLHRGAKDGWPRARGHAAYPQALLRNHDAAGQSANL